MQKIALFQVVLLLSQLSCHNKTTVQEPPLATVIKLISAESNADLDEAKKYIDLEKVYSGHPDSISPEQAWKDQVMFFFNLGKDKKFTNNFNYCDYVIKEELEGENARVHFEAKDPNDPNREMIYKLALYGNSWKVIGIEYIKNNTLNHPPK